MPTESFQSKVDGKRTRKMTFLEISIRQACHLIVCAFLDARRLISLPYSVKALIQRVINLKLSMQSFRKKRHQTPYSRISRSLIKFFSFFFFFFFISLYKVVQESLSPWNWVISLSGIDFVITTNSKGRPRWSSRRPIICASLTTSFLISSGDLDFRSLNSFTATGIPL